MVAAGLRLPQLQSIPNILPCLCSVQVVVGYLFSILPRQFYVPIDTEGGQWPTRRMRNAQFDGEG